jgi:adenosylmethionine-8-amino-7-oxononanoate aminotransferase
LLYVFTLRYFDVTHVFQRHLKIDPPKVASGDGIYLTDQNGKRYLDGSGGAAVSCLGHSDVDVIAAIKAQVDKVCFAHTSFLTSEPAEQLADLLISKAPEGISSVYFVSGGSEAVEAALKLARQYFLEVSQPERTHFIGRLQSYHGNTLGALGVGGNLARRKPFKDLLSKSSHISPCYAYRLKMDDETEEEYAIRAANELEVEILLLGPNKVAAFIAETVGGATAGVIPPSKGYFKRIRDICDQYGVLLILDEVMCGMGRTGSTFACEQDGISPDIVTIAKGLGAGYQPIGATLVKDKIHDAIRDGSGFFQHGHTYLGHPVACAAALAVQNKIDSYDLLQNVKAMGVELDLQLKERFRNHPNIGDIRGRGLFKGLELVADRGTKETLDPTLKTHAIIKQQAMLHGLICYPSGGTADGERGDHILLAPPFIITSDQIYELVDKLGHAVDASLRQIGLA